MLAVWKRFIFYPVGVCSLLGQQSLSMARLTMLPPCPCTQNGRAHKRSRPNDAGSDGDSSADSIDDSGLGLVASDDASDEEHEHQLDSGDGSGHDEDLANEEEDQLEAGSGVGDVDDDEDDDDDDDDGLDADKGGHAQRSKVSARAGL